METIIVDVLLMLLVAVVISFVCDALKLDGVIKIILILTLFIMAIIKLFF